MTAQLAECEWTLSNNSVNNSDSFTGRKVIDTEENTFHPIPLFPPLHDVLYGTDID